MLKGSVVALAILLTTSAVARAQATNDAEQVRARQRISMMEGVLERAVQNGADNLLRQVKSVMPNGAMLAGAPQARGFRLNGYGIFFDVEVPLLQLSVTWPLRAMMLNDTRATAVAVAELKALAAQLDAGAQARLSAVIRRLEQTVGPGGAPRPIPNAGLISSASTSTQPPAAVPPVSPAAPDLIDDPNDVYTREVKQALLEAMLENSGPLGLRDDEWLTVAARDNVPRDPLVPGSTVDFSTVIFRIKGSDLADFHARRITAEEARKRVEEREY